MATESDDVIGQQMSNTGRYQSQPERCPRCGKFRKAGTFVLVKPLSEFVAMSEGPTYVCASCAPDHASYRTPPSTTESSEGDDNS